MGIIRQALRRLRRRWHHREFFCGRDSSFHTAPGSTLLSETQRWLFSPRRVCRQPDCRNSHRLRTRAIQLFRNFRRRHGVGHFNLQLPSPSRLLSRTRQERALYCQRPHLEEYGSVWGSQVRYDTITLVIKEFWPDVRRKIQKKHDADAAVSQQADLTPPAR